MVWPIISLLVIAFAVVWLSEQFSSEAKCRRRRRKSTRPIAYKSDRPMIRLS